MSPGMHLPSYVATRQTRRAARPHITYWRGQARRSPATALGRSQSMCSHCRRQLLMPGINITPMLPRLCLPKGLPLLSSITAAASSTIISPSLAASPTATPLSSPHLAPQPKQHSWQPSSAAGRTRGALQLGRLHGGMLLRCSRVAVAPEAALLLRLLALPPSSAVAPEQGVAPLLLDTATTAATFAAASLCSAGVFPPPSSHPVPLAPLSDAAMFHTVDCWASAARFHVARCDRSDAEVLSTIKLQRVPDQLCCCFEGNQSLMT